MVLLLDYIHPYPLRILRVSIRQQRRPLTHNQGRIQNFQEHPPKMTILATGERAKIEATAAAGKGHFVLKRASHNPPRKSQSFPEEANL